MRHRWVVFGVVAGIAALGASGLGQQPAKKGLTSSYKNDVMHFELRGETGTLWYKCSQCGGWHKQSLTYERKVNLTWKDTGEKYSGYVYKVKGQDRWYFLSDDGVEVGDERGNTVTRFPIATSTVSSNKSFYRIKRARGTSRVAVVALDVKVTDPEEGDPGLPPVEKGTSEGPG